MSKKLFFISLSLLMILGITLGLTVSNKNSNLVTVTNFKESLEKCKTFPIQGSSGYSLDDSLVIQDCFLKYLEKIPAAKDRIGLLVKFGTDPYFQGMCHSLTHELGVYEYKQNPDLSKLFAIPGATFCENGYIHGVLWQMSAEIDYPKLLANGPSICKPLVKDILSYIGCIHGMGHGSYETAGKNLLLASDFCDTLETEYTILQCKQGAMMSYGKDKYFKEIGQTPLPSRYETLCNEADMISHGLQRPCLQVGLDKSNKKDFHKSLATYCNSLKGTLENDCWYGVVESYVPFYLRDIDPHTICQANNVTSQEICIHHLTQQIGAFWGVKAGQDYCVKLKESDQPYCRKVTPFEMAITETDSYLNKEYKN